MLPNTLLKMGLFTPVVRQDGFNHQPVVTFDVREVLFVEEHVSRMAPDIQGVYKCSMITFKNGRTISVWNHVAQEVFDLKTAFEAGLRPIRASRDKEKAGDHAT